MKTKFLVIPLLIVFLVMGLSSSDLTYGNDLPPLKIHDFSPVTYTGDIIIEQNGSVDLNATGSPMSHVGDKYYLNENVTGTILILHNGTILDGNGHSVSLTSAISSTGIVSIINSNNVSAFNFSISGSHSTYSNLFLNNTSNDHIFNLSLSSSLMGVAIWNYTHNVNVSNVAVSYADYVGILGGVFFQGSGLPVPSASSSNLTFYNETIHSGFDSYPSVIMGAGHSELLGSVISSVFLGASALASIANNTLFENNNISIGLSFGGAFHSSTLPGASHYSNVSFINNTINEFDTIGPSSFGIYYSNTSGTISGNVINSNNSGSTSLGIYVGNGSVNILNNEVNFTDVNGTMTSYSYGIQYNSSNLNITNNIININGNESIGIGVPISASGDFGNFSNVNFNGNILNFNGTYNAAMIANGSRTEINNNIISMKVTNYSSEGILYNGNYFSISGNSISIGVVSPGFSSDFGISNLIGTTISQFNHNNVNGNRISISGIQNHNYTGFYGGVYLDSPGSSWFNFTGNQVTFSHNIIGSSILLALDSNVSISNNIISGAAGIYSLSNSTELSGNNISYAIYGLSVGSSSYVTNNIQVKDNEFTSTNASSTASMEFTNVQNITITGNYVNSSGSYFLGLEGGVVNFRAYQNDFYGNHTQGIIQESNITGKVNGNINFNASYPLGGNYWSAATGNDLNSGPGQNITGPDGILDKAYGLGGSFMDKYPLAKPWLRPQVTFRETGLIAGTAWSVTFNGQTRSSTGNNITFSIINGTFQGYGYHIMQVPGYSGGDTSGTYSYEGAGTQTYSVAYVPLSYLNITEKGLPAGSTWTLKVNGTTYSVTKNYLLLSFEDNPSVNYTIYNSTLYYTSVFSGITAVSGMTYVNTTFSHYAYISGTLAPSSANVTVNGARVSQSGGTFNVTLTGGSYEIVVGDNGYSSYYKNVTLTPGQSLVLNITLNKTKSPGIPASTYEFIAAGAAAVIIIAIVVLMLRKK